MTQYINYLSNNIKTLGIYGTLLIILFYIIYKIKNMYEENNSLHKIVKEQNNNIRIQKNLLNVTQITKPDSISNNFKRMRSKK